MGSLYGCTPSGVQKCNCIKWRNKRSTWDIVYLQDAHHYTSTIETKVCRHAKMAAKICFCMAFLCCYNRSLSTKLWNMAVRTGTGTGQFQRHSNSSERRDGVKVRAVCKSAKLQIKAGKPNSLWILFRRANQKADELAWLEDENNESVIPKVTEVFSTIHSTVTVQALSHHNFFIVLKIVGESAPFSHIDTTGTGYDIGIFSYLLQHGYFSQHTGTLSDEIVVIGLDVSDTSVQ